MGKETGIAWCNSTRNFWSGCTKVSPGCDFCYAETFQRFVRGKSEATGEAKNWGAGAPRIEHLKGAARDIRNWNRQAAARNAAAGKRIPWRVFLNSHSDFFDNEVPNEWRELGWSVMRECTELTFLLVTKRIGNVKNMLPPDWGSGYPNVWLIITIVNELEMVRDIPKLMEFPCAVKGVSFEPALNRIVWRDSFGYIKMCREHWPNWHLDWLIIGGESKQREGLPREFKVEWADEALAACREYNVAAFMKQMGGNATYGGQRISFNDYEAGADPEEWRPELRVRQFPDEMVKA